MILIFAKKKEIQMVQNLNAEIVKINKERIGQDRYYNISSEKIKKELKWKAKIDFDLGLMMTYKWIQDNFDYLKKKKLFYQHKK